MPGEKFTTFVEAAPIASALAGSEPIPCIQGGVTKQTTPAAIAALVPSQAVAYGPIGVNTVETLVIGAPGIYGTAYNIQASFWQNVPWLAGGSDAQATLAWTDPVSGPQTAILGAVTNSVALTGFNGPQYIVARAGTSVTLTISSSAWNAGTGIVFLLVESMGTV